MGHNILDYAYLDPRVILELSIYGIQDISIYIRKGFSSGWFI